MGFMSLRTASTWALLTCILALGACSKEKKAEVAEEEITSINVYFSNEDVSGQQVGKIYSYNPSNGISTELASFNDGEGMAVALDTDESKPGFEYAVYVDDKTVKLLDYSKSAAQRTYTLQTFSQDICGLHIAERPAPSVLESTSDYYLSTIHDTAINVSLKNGVQCSRDTDRYFLLDFEPSKNNTISNARDVRTSEVFGAFLISPTYEAISPETGETKKGRSIWVGHDRDSQTLKVRDYQGTPLAEINFPFASTPPFIFGINDSLLVIQRDQEIYKLTTTVIEQLLAPSETVSPSAKVEAYFQQSLATLNLSDDSQAIPLESSDRYLAFEDDDHIYRHEVANNLVEIATTKSPSLTGLNFSVMTSGSLVMEKSYASFQTLSVQPNTPGASEKQLIISADLVEHRTDGINIYANVLNTIDVLGEPVSTTSWVATSFEDTNLNQLIEDSLFVFANGGPNQADTILLLVSSQPTASYSLVSPYVYQYDSESSDGKLTFTTKSDDGTKITSITEGQFGQIQEDIYGIGYTSKGSHFLLNKEFGGIRVSTATNDQAYFFRPSQSFSQEEIEKGPSLSRILEDIPSNNTRAFNGFSSNAELSERSISL